MRAVASLAIVASLAAFLHPTTVVGQVPILTLERSVPLWELLPEEEGRPRSIAVDGRGRVAIGQRGPARVFVIERDGSLRRSIGRDGRGPGELLSPMVAWFGDSVVVWDGQQRCLSIFAIESGAAISETTVALSGTLIGVSDSGLAMFRNSLSSLERSGLGVSVVRVTLGGRIVDTLEHVFPRSTQARTPTTWRVRLAGGGGFTTTIPYTPHTLVALHRSGRLAVSHPTERAIRTLDAGSASRVLYRDTRARTAIPVSRRLAARDSAVAADAGGQARATLEAVYRVEDVPAHFAPWSRMDYSGGGILILTDPASPRDSVRFLPINRGLLGAAVSLPATLVGELRAWSEQWMASLVDTDQGTLLTVFRIR